MGRLFVLFFLMPWWAYIPASIGVYWLGERVYEQALETELDKASVEASLGAVVKYAEDREKVNGNSMEALIARAVAITS
mgnify:CR=1 FL=1